MTSNETQPHVEIDIDRFRDAMTRFPSRVTIVTTTDASGAPRGFTATSFCSLSADPALVLVCIAKKAECHEAFLEADRWNIHVAAHGQAELAMLFATRGADKFIGGVTLDEAGQPLLAGSSVTLQCSAFDKLPGGDHTILIGRVDGVDLEDADPTVYHRREFRCLSRVS